MNEVDVADPRAALRLLEQRARKRFGQHFLTDASIVERMVRGAGIQRGDRVVEVGPGLGVLTHALRAAGAEVTAVELDRDLVAFLGERFPDLRLISGDALAMDWRALCEGSGWKLVSNLPYNVGTHLLMQVLRRPDVFSTATVMLQREVIQRLCGEASSPAYGAISVEAQVRASGRFLFSVPPQVFHPPPKVYSSVARFDLFAAPDTGGVDPDTFDKVVRAAFAQRRKTIQNSLQTAFLKDKVASALAEAGIDPRARGETLDAAGYRRLARALTSA